MNGRDKPDHDEKAGLLGFRLEVHRLAVDAVAQAGGRRAVREDMAEMAAAIGAMDLDAVHAVAAILRGADSALKRLVEARPAGAALEFLAGLEQLLVATGAGEGAGALLVVERAGAGALGAVPCLLYTSRCV